MKIALINTYDNIGGAAKAAYRLHRGLCKAGTDCKMLVLNKVSDDKDVIKVTQSNALDISDDDYYLKSVIQDIYINTNRTSISNTLFSYSYPGYDISSLPVILSADIINLHWLATYQSPATLSKIIAIGKPIVWTLHDMWPFTGGCHYSAGCEKYIDYCLKCPQLDADPFDLTVAIVKDKIDLFKNANLTIVSPSKWLADCARKSNIFKQNRVEVIPNSIDTDCYYPVAKFEAKKRIGIEDDVIALLFAADSGAEARKGFNELVNAVKWCCTVRKFQDLVDNNRIIILSVGNPNPDLEKIGIPVLSLGYLKSEEKMRIVYSAADIFILPSLEDNLPNTMLESMSCGTPVVAFIVGGIPDVVINDITGKIVPAKDSIKLGEAVLDVIFNEILRKGMQSNCRHLIENKFTISAQAENYYSLFEDLISKNESNNNSNRKLYYNKSTKTEYGNECFCNIDTSLGKFSSEIYEKIVLSTLKDTVIKLQAQLNASTDEIIRKNDLLLAVTKQLYEIKSSLCWRMTEPCRKIIDSVSALISRLL